MWSLLGQQWWVTLFWLERPGIMLMIPSFAQYFNGVQCAGDLPPLPAAQLCP